MGDSEVGKPALELKDMLADLQAEMEARFSAISRRLSRIEQRDSGSFFDGDMSSVLERLFIFGVIVSLVYLGFVFFKEAVKHGDLPLPKA